MISADDLIDKGLEILKTGGIPFTLFRHEPAKDEEAFRRVARMANLDADCVLVKSLLCSSKKKSDKLVFICSPTSMSVNLSILGDKYRLARSETLSKALDVTPGNVSPLHLLNAEPDSITVYFDESLQGDVQIGIHPLHNTATVVVNARDICDLLTAHGHTVLFQPLASDVPVASKPSTKTSADTPTPAAAKGEDTNILGITCPKTSFADWYTQVIVKGGLIEYYDISGCYILRPWAYGLWERIQAFLDKHIKLNGVENCYFPMFVSQDKLEREKDHIEGFSPEVAWVTRSGSNELTSPIAIRPTSETIMYPTFAKWIRSHRDLPLKLNQWTNVVRWEFKQPTPFIRTREFLWQEGHTAHASKQEAEDMALAMLEVYACAYEELLAVPIVRGVKSENEKFAGGYRTHSVEAYISANGRAVQAATSHELGQNFSRMFDIYYENEAKERELVFQTSWGFTTRSIGVVIMVHGDDRGLVLPPRVANIQATIIPIIGKGGSNWDELCGAANELKAQLASVCRVTVDDRQKYTPGYKFNDLELKGVPLRLELGPRDVASQQVVVVARHSQQKWVIPWQELTTRIPLILDQIHNEMFEKAKTARDTNITKIDTMEEAVGILDKKNWILAPWCETPESEEKFKEYTRELSENLEQTGAFKSLCIPKEQPVLPAGTKCFITQEPATCWCLFGRSY